MTEEDRVALVANGRVTAVSVCQRCGGTIEHFGKWWLIGSCQSVCTTDTGELEDHVPIASLTVRAADVWTPERIESYLHE